jgi:hypothetical protein
MLARTIQIACLAFAACLASSASMALVGATQQDGPMAPHVVMVLASSGSGGGFCTGVVIAPTVVLTAAHCVSTPQSTRIYFKAGEAPVFMEIAAATVHPQYRAQAPRTRERSIDIALIRVTSPLPSRFKPIALDVRAPGVGDAYGLSGFGVTREGHGETGGLLRWGEVTTQAPLSAILLWAQDSAGKGFGACEGDSGGPVFALDTGALVAITSWSEGEGKARCGKLTQAALVAPQRAWMDGALKAWGLAR